MRRPSFTVPGTRASMLACCAGVWAMVGLGVCLDASRGYHPDLFHTSLPLWFRAGGWWVSGLLALYGSLSNRNTAVVVGVLVVMPLQRVASYGGAWAVALIPGGHEGLIHGWYSATYYVLMTAFVVMIAHIREPDARRGGEA